jgi:hypothetical protein
MFAVPMVDKVGTVDGLSMSRQIEIRAVVAEVVVGLEEVVERLSLELALWKLL